MPFLGVVTYIRQQVNPTACKAASPPLVVFLSENAVEESIPINKKECNFQGTSVKLHPYMYCMCLSCTAKWQTNA